jgi:hypothetical protein
MKTHLIKIAVTTLIAFNAQAKDILISDQTYNLEVKLDKNSVKCLVGDYGASSLKIVVPEIRYFANLDHTSEGSGGPCINAGRCNQGNKDSRFSILHDLARPTEQIKLRVLKTENYEIIDDACQRSYHEKISSNVRGTDFIHFASAELATLDKKFCLALGVVPTAESK